MLGINLEAQPPSPKTRTEATAALGKDLYGKRLTSEERRGKLYTAIDQSMDALLSGTMMGDVYYIGPGGIPINASDILRVCLGITQMILLNG